MAEIEHSYGAPSESPTDLAANAAFDAIDRTLLELGFDPARSHVVVMVLIPDGSPHNATVAGHLPNAESTEALLEHILGQSVVLAQECGVTIIAAKNRQN